MRYTFVHKGDSTICWSKYAGKSVWGAAKRHPEDAADTDHGERIARLRCDRKIAKKRMAFQAKQIAKCERLLGTVVHDMNRHTNVYTEAMKELEAIEKELRSLKVHL